MEMCTLQLCICTLFRKWSFSLITWGYPLFCTVAQLLSYLKIYIYINNIRVNTPAVALLCNAGGESCNAKTMKPTVQLCTFRCNYLKKLTNNKNAFLASKCANAQLKCAHFKKEVLLCQ